MRPLAERRRFQGGGVGLGAFFIVFIMVAVGLPAVAGSTAASSTSSALPAITAPYLTILITNHQATPTGVYQQMLSFDSATYAAYLNTNDSNLRFGYSTSGPAIPSWIEDNASSSSTNTTIWLNLTSIGAGSSLLVYAIFDPLGTYDWSVAGPTGAYPNATVGYGVGDDGATIFDYYQNFVGTSLPSGWSSACAAYSVHNLLGLTQGWALCALSSYVPKIGQSIDVRYTDPATQYFAWGLNSGLYCENRGPDHKWGFEGGLIHSSSWQGPSVNNAWTVSSCSVESSSLLSNNYTATDAYATLVYSAGYLGFGLYEAGTSNNVLIQWTDVRTDPPNQVMPSVAFGVIAVTAPTAPTGLGASGVTTTSMTWSWSLPSGEFLTNVTLLNRTGAAGVWYGHSLGASAVSYAMGGEATNSNNCVEVFAWNAGGQGAIAGPVCAVTASVPSAPTDITVTGIWTLGFNMTWSNPVGQTLTDTVISNWHGQGCSGAPAYVADLGGVYMGYGWTGLMADHPYSFEIQVKNGTGLGAFSTCLNLVSASLPSAPTGLAASVVHVTSLGWTWTLPSGQSLTNVTLLTRQAAGGLWHYHSLGGSAVSYTLTGLTGNVVYCAEVWVWNVTGPSPLDGPVCQPTASLPSAPTGLAAPTITTSSVLLTWTEPAVQIPFYTAGIVWIASYSGSLCGAFAQYASTIGTSQSVTGLLSGYAYCFQVDVANATGWSANSTVLSDVYTWALPSAPTLLSVLPQAFSTNLLMYWTLGFSVPAILNQTVMEVLGPSCSYAPPTFVNVVSGSATSTSAPTLYPGDPYSFEIAEWNSVGMGAWSNCVTGSSNFPIPAAPTYFAFDSAGASSVTLNWTNPVTLDLVNTTVAYTTVAGCVGAMTQVSAGLVNSKTVYSLTSATTYYWQVAAWSNGGESPWSGCIVGATVGTSLPAPTGLSVTDIQALSVVLAWSNPVGYPVTDDMLFVSYANGTCGTWSPLTVDIGIAVSSYSLTGLALNTQYCVEVMASSGPSTSPHSAPLFFTTNTQLAPLPPGGFTLSTIDELLIAAGTLATVAILVAMLYWHKRYKEPLA